MPTPIRAATGMPTPKPTPRAVVLDFLAGSASTGAVGVDDALALEPEDPVAALAVDAGGEALEVAAEEVEEEVAEVVEVRVCV